MYNQEDKNSGVKKDNWNSFPKYPPIHFTPIIKVTWARCINTCGKLLNKQLWLIV